MIDWVTDRVGERIFELVRYRTTEEVDGRTIE